MIRATVAGLQGMDLPFIPRAWVVSFWQWATLYRDVPVLEVRFFFWTKVVQFKHLFPILERILGRPPLAA